MHIVLWDQQTRVANSALVIQESIPEIELVKQRGVSQTKTTGFRVQRDYATQ